MSRKPEKRPIYSYRNYFAMIIRQGNVLTFRQINNSRSLENKIMGLTFLHLPRPLITDSKKNLDRSPVSRTMSKESNAYKSHTEWWDFIGKKGCLKQKLEDIASAPGCCIDHHIPLLSDILARNKLATSPQQARVAACKKNKKPDDREEEIDGV